MPNKFGRLGPSFPQLLAHLAKFDRPRAHSTRFRVKLCELDRAWSDLGKIRPSSKTCSVPRSWIGPPHARYLDICPFRHLVGHNSPSRSRTSGSNPRGGIVDELDVCLAPSCLPCAHPSESYGFRAPGSQRLLLAQPNGTQRRIAKWRRQRTRAPATVQQEGPEIGAHNSDLDEVWRHGGVFVSLSVPGRSHPC